MKKIIIASLLLLTISSVSFGQAKFLSRAGHIWFYSKTPVETIEAHNYQVASFLDVTKGTIAFEVLNKSFKFERALMEEHFNENYMESEKFPKATFKGQITNLKDINFSKDGVYDITLKGTLDMHGVKAAREIKGKLIIKNGAPVKATATFDVKLVDHKIKIPKAVVMNIAEVIAVDVDFALERYQK